MDLPYETDEGARAESRPDWSPLIGFIHVTCSILNSPQYLLISVALYNKT